MSALTPEQIQLFIQNVVDNGAEHDDGCPGDDTCECSEKPLRDATNAVCHAIETELPSLRAQLTAREQGLDFAKRHIANLNESTLAAEVEVERISKLLDRAVGDDMGDYQCEHGQVLTRECVECDASWLKRRKAALAPSQPPQTTETRG